MSDSWHEGRFEEEFSTPSSVEGLSSSWVNDPDYQALCEDIARLCYELARDREAIKSAQDDTPLHTTPESS